MTFLKINNNQKYFLKTYKKYKNADEIKANQTCIK